MNGVGRAFALLISLVGLTLGLAAQVTPAAETAARGSLLSPSERRLLRDFGLPSLEHRAANRGFSLYDAEDEQALGDAVAQQIEATTKLVQDEGLEQYLGGLALKLSTAAHLSHAPRVRIVQSDEVNASALPNGTIYVTTGLVLAADDESELAGVLAHEIAHVTEHHAARSLSRRFLWNVASVAASMFSGGVAGFVAPQAAGAAGSLLALKFDRKSESEADILGSEYLYLAGYDHNGLTKFLARMEQPSSANRSRFGKLLRTHPDAQERIRSTSAALRLLIPADTDEQIVDSSAFQQAKARTAELTDRDGGLPRKPTLHIRTAANN